MRATKQSDEFAAPYAVRNNESHSSVIIFTPDEKFFRHVALSKTGKKPAEYAIFFVIRRNARSRIFYRIFYRDLSPFERPSDVMYHSNKRCANIAWLRANKPAATAKLKTG